MIDKACSTLIHGQENIADPDQILIVKGIMFKKNRYIEVHWKNLWFFYP